MIAGLDSSFAVPTLQQAQAAKATGVSLWSGYLQTKPEVHIGHAWSKTDFATVATAGLRSIAFCSGHDDPTACKELAADYGVLLCLDVEGSTREDGPWVQSWLRESEAGLYGNASVFTGRRAAFFVLAAYPGGNPFKTWNGPNPGCPTGWQWWGDHTEFGCSVDRGNYDDWFGQSAITEDVDMPGQGFWNGTSHTLYVESNGQLTHTWTGGGSEGLGTGFRPGTGVSVLVGPTDVLVAAVNTSGVIKRYQQQIGHGGWNSLDG